MGMTPMYLPENLDEMQRRIEQYFTDCEGEPLLDPNTGDFQYDKYGNVIMKNVKPLTITGLALAIGFTSRQSLLNYQEKPEFVDTITRAKARVEQYAEERLFDKDGANGAKFSLANNFVGWKEKREIDADVKNSVTINVEPVDDDE